jgi:large subunit GTPase 1
MPVDILERQEKDAFLEWRRNLAELQDKENFLLTPFERNLEVWRQLWRVVERAHLVVQIVDARNPLRFWCEDLENYVGQLASSDTGNPKSTLLLINKSDLLSSSQRCASSLYTPTKLIQTKGHSGPTSSTLGI